MIDRGQAERNREMQQRPWGSQGQTEEGNHCQSETGK